MGAELFCIAKSCLQNVAFMSNSAQKTRARAKPEFLIETAPESKGASCAEHHKQSQNCNTILRRLLFLNKQ